MQDEDLFSHNVPPSTTSDHERGSDHHASSTASSVSGEAPASAHPPETQRRLTPRHPLRLLLVVMVVVVLVVLAGGYSIFRAVTIPSPHMSSAFQEVHCPFLIGAGLVEGKDVRCGFLTVPEDRSQPQGPTIRLAVAVFKTPSPHPAPDPVLVLGGGPGVPQLASASSIDSNNLASFTSGRDRILLDQRGVGYSQPSLSCQDNETLSACHDRLVREGINLNSYTTLENAADVHDLAHALGYKQINLEGRSYGTRLALTVMRLYPADLRSVVLISVFPPQANLFADKAAVTQHAFDVLFQGCMANSYCNTTYPQLQTTFYRMVSELNNKPITFEAIDPQTGNRSAVRLTGDGLVYWLFSALYETPLIPQLPGVLFRMSHQDYTQLAFLYGGVGFPLSEGMFASVECSEDMAYITPQRLQASVQILAPELRPAIRTSLQMSASACQLWDVKTVPAIQKEPVKSPIPTLIMEGEYDPVTPPANGVLAAQTLSRSFFFLFPGVSHGVKSPNPCPGNVELAFLDNPTVRPDASCISSMPEPDFT